MYLHIYLPTFWFVCFSSFLYRMTWMRWPTYTPFSHSYSWCWNLFSLHFCSTESSPSIEKEDEYPVFRAAVVTVLLLGSFPVPRTMYGCQDCQTSAAPIPDISTLTNTQKAFSFKYILSLFSSLYTKAFLNFNCGLLLPWVIQSVYIAEFFSLN